MSDFFSFIDFSNINGIRSDKCRLSVRCLNYDCLTIYFHTFVKLATYEKKGQEGCMCGYLATRWWLKLEVMNQLCELFGDLESFLSSLDIFGMLFDLNFLEF